MARSDQELEIYATSSAVCTKLRHRLPVEAAFVVKVITSEFKECLLIRADVVPFNSSPEEMLEPMRAALEHRRRSRARSLSS